MEINRTHWRWALAPVFAIAILTALPQVFFVTSRGADWHGANAEMHPDEVAYSAYVNSLIRGRPRRNDPFTGREDREGKPAPESLFSIQMVPAYLAALPARILGLTSSTVFIIFPVLCAAAAAFAVFWLLSILTRDSRFAAAATFVVLCLGTPMARQGIVRYVPNLPYLIPAWLSDLVLPPSAYHLPFVRFYQPAIGFPLFFLLCVLMWLALTNTNQRKAMLQAATAGVVFVLLVFTYFYLWTAAAAWLFCLAVVWWPARKNEWRSVIVLSIVGAIGVVGTVPYFLMLGRRASTVDSAQAMVFSHRPDLFRVCEIAAMIVLASLIFGALRRRFRWHDASVLFTASLALSVLAVFNQQLITGRSLQPIHYEWFIGNYCALVAVVLATFLFWRKRSPAIITNKGLLVISLVAFAWGGMEVWLAASRNYEHNRRIDELRPVAIRLRELANTDGTTNAEKGQGEFPIVLISELALADRLPTDAPQALLWSPRMLVFPGVTEQENRERFLQQLYYLGFDKKKMDYEMNRGDWNFFAGMFPYYRLSRVVSGHGSPIFPEEIEDQIQTYLAYAQSFNREKASSPRLSYLILPVDKQPDYSNLDRWYQRDAAERIGNFVLYRLELRP